MVGISTPELSLGLMSVGNRPLPRTACPLDVGVGLRWPRAVEDALGRGVSRAVLGVILVFDTLGDVLVAPVFTGNFVARGTLSRPVLSSALPKAGGKLMWPLRPRMVISVCWRRGPCPPN